MRNDLYETNYLEDPNSEFQISGLKLFNDLFYLLDSVRHGNGGCPCLAVFHIRWYIHQLCLFDRILKQEIVKQRFNRVHH